jgi:P-type conjugative transfer protein TrbG
MNAKHLLSLSSATLLLCAAAPAPVAFAFPAMPKPVVVPKPLAKPAVANKVVLKPMPAKLPMMRKPIRKAHARHVAIHRSHWNHATRVAAATRAATEEPTGFVNASSVYPYAEGSVFHVYTAPGRITDIALQPGEVLGAVAAGDTVRWIIGDTASGAGGTKRSHVLVKPAVVGLSTNLVITTDRHVYHLSLTSTARTALTALSWTYPQDQLIALQKRADAAEAAAPVASGLAIDQLHFGYAVTGDKPDWRPLRAFDDGRQTFIEFPAQIATGVAPPLFVVGANGTAELVNYRMRGHYYVVDRLFDVAELRFGLKRQQVVRITRLSDGSAARRAA